MSAILPHMVCPSANFRCRSEMCCTGLAENTGRKKVAKNRYLGTITQLCRAISSQLRHVSTIGKKLLSSNMSSRCPPRYGELRPTSGWDWSGSLEHPYKFQRLSRLGSITARQSSSERQPNFAALNRGRHLCLSWRPSRWALAHILVFTVFQTRMWAYAQHDGCPRNIGSALCFKWPGEKVP